MKPRLPVPPASTGTPLPPLARRVFCNRSVDMRSIRAVGYDMDYTLVHYDVEAFERHAYEHVKARLSQYGWPVGPLVFDPLSVIRGLVIDRELGNLLKANRFGFVKSAVHGSRRLLLDEVMRTYARTVVDPATDDRFMLVTTLFALSEACLYMQLVDLHDRRKLPGARSYSDIHQKVRTSTDLAHFEGEIKPKILAHPGRFIIPDPETPRTLMDQKAAGKTIMLITNSDWQYTSVIMKHAFDRHLPAGVKWRDLFDVVIVSADKPAFFSTRRPLYEVADPTMSLLKPSIKGLRPGRIFWGGHVSHVEKYLDLSGDQILYVGDHIIGDVEVTKSVLRWRTGLVLRELEDEIRDAEILATLNRDLEVLMARKERAEFERNRFELDALRRAKGGRAAHAEDSLRRHALDADIAALDRHIKPLAQRFNRLGNPRWGLLMRAGSEKSLLARTVENSADLYMSRVSNLAAATPFCLFRSWPGSLPHEIE